MSGPRPPNYNRRSGSLPSIHRTTHLHVHLHLNLLPHAPKLVSQAHTQLPELLLLLPKLLLLLLMHMKAHCQRMLRMTSLCTGSTRATISWSKWRSIRLHRRLCHSSTSVSSSGLLHLLLRHKERPRPPRRGRHGRHLSSTSTLTAT